MKKLLVILTVLIGSCLNMFSQWKGQYNGEKSPMIMYTQADDFPNVNIVGYGLNQIRIMFVHHSTANFDLWWDSHMNDNGWIRYYSDVDLNFIGTDGKEYKIEDVLISNIDNEGDYFKFSIFIDDVDGELLSKMKSNDNLNIKFYDIVKDDTTVISVPLTGVTTQCEQMGL